MLKNSEVMMRDKICCASFCKSLVAAPWVAQFLSVITSDAITWATTTCSRREREREDDEANDSTLQSVE